MWQLCFRTRQLLSLYQTISTLLTLGKKSSENVVGKGKNAENTVGKGKNAEPQHFPIFPCFLLVEKKFNF